ncbi:MAG: LCP family protein [Patescibacteria group bacterium]|nr:LCP family protein [Patescibacteria group bacterium]
MSKKKDKLIVHSKSRIGLNKDLGFSKDKNKKQNFVFKDKSFFILRLKKVFLKNIIWIKILFVSTFILVLYFSFIFVQKTLVRFQIPFYSSLFVDFLTTPPHKILSTEGRTNVLILGKGGEGHDAPELTDTIIFMSINHSDSSIVLISIPRDIWITDLRGKINSVYMQGNDKEQGGGIYLVKSVVSGIVGEKIQYYALVDFSGFKKLIDVVGGIEVEVANSFTDNHFPIPGRENDLCGGDPTLSCRHETIKFEKGLTHMDGEMALKFARSRYAKGEEGTDFARGARQQLVIDAFIKKILTKEILFSKNKLIEIKETVLSVVQTDIPLSGLAIVARRLYDNKGISKSYVIPQDFLFVPNYSPKYDNLYVILPVGGNWQKVQEWVDSILYSKN